MTLTSTFAFPRSAFLGFDHIFDELNNIRLHAHDGYPPHNVIKTGEKSYTIELAVAGFKKADLNVELKEGMCLAIEPMVNVGTRHIKTDSDGWTIRTEDGSASAHFEHSILITKFQPRILT